MRIDNSALILVVLYIHMIINKAQQWKIHLNDVVL